MAAADDTPKVCQKCGGRTYRRGELSRHCMNCGNVSESTAAESPVGRLEASNG
jgi:hypothetical protein